MKYFHLYNREELYLLLFIFDLFVFLLLYDFHLKNDILHS